MFAETNILQDGTLVDLCGATLLWRSAEGLKNSPVILLDSFIEEIYLYANPFVDFICCIITDQTRFREAGR